MTLVRNHRLPLSGNKYKLLILSVVFWAAACSPKTQPIVNKPQPSVTPPAAKPAEKPVATTPVKAAKPAPQKVSGIAMLLPFNLDNLNQGGKYSKADLQKANMAVEYYQGFKLALDSLTSNGYNYRLQLLDSKDQPAEARNLSLNPKLYNNDLIVGPIFPDGIKAFNSTNTGITKKPVLSPLSPASPSGFHSPLLITAIPPLDYHAKRAAQYVYERLKAKKVFVLKSGFSVDNNYLTPFKQQLDSLSKQHVKLIPLTVVRGDLKPLLPQLSKTEDNVFVLPSTNQAFLQVTLRALDTLAKAYPVVLIGHPSWEKLTFLRADALQRLKTVITSSDHVNYKSGSMIGFIKAYRKAYHLEPSEFSIKGFDEGFYFGELLAQSETGTLKPETLDFEGLHNKFHFVKKPTTGWVNTHVYILKYTNFELKAIE
ncbi:ABC transporter substrate-binding protein [Mucilaginibacter sp. R11]|uniref:ABC transporter substrate-binding protein n=1 Tax=Mucilaginibacter agri TaxID=2695265 RepID=A0A965ZJQ1_9SPHI|nr:ABC transporter substrate-binding protein [Mucilaginibacter agri]